jgi:hypothetical protein
MVMTHINSRRLALLLISSLPLPAIAADAVPKPFGLARYQPMMDHSPFAVATAVVAPSAPNFSKDLYVANAARDKEGDFVTIASSTDKNFKKYLTTNTPVDGYSIVSIEWSEKVGSTKVTIGKDGQIATLSFNEALVRGPAGPGQVPQPVKDPQQQQQAQQPPMPQDRSAVAQPPSAIVPGSAPNVAKPVAPGAQQNATKPMPVPMLPSAPPRVRGVIPRNPTAKDAVKPQKSQPEL